MGGLILLASLALLAESRWTLRVVTVLIRHF